MTRASLATPLLLLALGLAATAACGDDGGGTGGAAGTGGAGTTSAETTAAPASGSTGGGQTGDPCEDVPEGCFDPAACYADPPGDVSFRDDVLPILERSCSLSSACHGNAASPTTASGYRPYLGGAGSAESDVPTILAAIVDVDSWADTSKKVVVPGDWENSFFMNKVDGALDQCASTSCPDGCGRLMPQGPTKPLPLAERNLMRAWIEQGAQDN